MHLNQIFIISWVLIHQTIGIRIPQDVEILDGYDFEESPEYYQPDSVYFEARSMVAGMGQPKSIRNRRSTSAYDAAKESLLRPSTTTNEHSPDKKTLEILPSSSEKHELPKAEKQVMEPEIQRREYWNDFSWNVKHDDDDMVPDIANDGFRGRQPRVNFITHPKKIESEPKDRAVLKVATPQPKPRYELYEPYKYEMYPSRSYDPYLRRYDRFDEQYNRDFFNYDDHYLYRRHHDPYDSYSPRVPRYPEPYYAYPDSRYDVPEPRDYRPVYSNEIYDRPTYENRNRRIVYYAHLPEIIRPPPSMDYTYRYDRNRGNPMESYKTPEKPSDGQPQPYGFVKREKKDHRKSATISPNKSPGREH